jgi:hypothetical protein
MGLTILEAEASASGLAPATPLRISLTPDWNATCQSIPSVTDIFSQNDPHSESAESSTTCVQSERRSNISRKDTFQPIRSIRKRMFSIGKAKSRWSDATICVGDFCGTKGKYNYWQARGRAQECFEILAKEIIVLLERTCGPVPASSHVIINMSQ